MLATIQTSAVLVPLPVIDVKVRAGTADDIPFMDSLQKLHTKQVGWMPTKQFEGKVALGHVLIAEVGGERVGYLIGNDQYFKRDDVGIIYQVNVAPIKQRGFIGASLLKAQFERSAYGCKLYCCWCAQDIAANRFWEAMGFVPLAFRAGSEKKSRVHIFWQKRIREADAETPWWFPSQTSGGSIREDRIVLPIPPGTHWSDAKPLVLPSAELPVVSCPLPVAQGGTRRARKSATTGNGQLTTNNSNGSKPSLAMSGGLRFVAPAPPPPAAPAVATPPIEKPKRERKPKPKNNPTLVAAARELRDRWLEEVNSGRYLPTAEAKYAVSRAIEDRRAEQTPSMPTLSPAKLLAA